jgi:hypothetical protein
MTTATSTAQALDEASQAISDVAYSFQQAEAESMSLWLNEDDPCPQKLAFLVQHLETVQAGISKALAAAKTAQAQLGEA